MAKLLNGLGVFSKSSHHTVNLGQNDLSILNYKKSLEKNPNNDNAKDKLKELESQLSAGN